MSGKEQPKPTPYDTDEPDIQTQVIADFEERREVGIGRYGTAVQPFNGRSALQDIYEELMDATVYIKQSMVERDDLIRMIGHVRELHDIESHTYIDLTKVLALLGVSEES